MEALLEIRRWALPGLLVAFALLFVAGNLLLVARRLLFRARSSPAPLIGTLCGVLALIAVPLSLSWQWVIGIVVGLIVVEFAGIVTNSALSAAPSGSEEPK